MDRANNVVDAVVMGGGVMGCAAAYYLLEAGVKRVILVEKGAICSGSSGRCAGGFRQQFPTVPEVKLAMDSIKRMETLADELEADFEFRQGGYLVLSYTNEHAEGAKKTIAMQQGLGLPVVWKSPQEINTLAPWLNADEGFIGGAWCPTDGVLNPFKFTFAYAEACERLGGQIMAHNAVTNIIVEADGTYTVHTEQGEFHTEMLVNCTGAYSAKIGEMLGVEIPVVPLAREKIVTEPVKFFQPFLCNSPLHTLHFNQTNHGSFLMSCANMSIKQRGDFKNTWRFAQETADAVRRLVPALRKARILRQWAGYYETTKDGKPFIGRIEGLKNFVQTVGYNGHGLMLAPAAAQAVVNDLLGKPVPDWYDAFAMSRIYQ